MFLTHYSIQDFTHNVKGNIFGGVTAAIVALPLALAFGISSGIGPIAGLYGAVVLGIFATVFGGTRPQISGPTGPMTVVVTAMTAHYLSTYPEDGLTLVFTTVFLAGLMQLAMGVLRLGKYIIMVPYPVISGFMTGIGVIIIVLQLAPLMGFAAEGSVIDAIKGFPEQVMNVQTSALVLGGITLFLLFVWRGRPNQIIPSPLLGLVVATLLAYFFLGDDSVSRIGAIPAALPEFNMPQFKMDLLQDMLMNALMLAVLGSIDSLLTSLVADSLGKTAHDSDQELIGQGIGNTLAGLLGALPGAGATMRTVVNIRAGGDGPLSGVVHALILILALAGLGFLFASIPLAALAAVLIKVGIDIIDWPFLRRIHQLPKFTAILMLLVLFLTVFVDLITAVFVGVFIKNMMVLNQLSDIELGNVLIADGQTNDERFTQDEKEILQKQTERIVLLKITGPLSYAVSRGLKQRLQSIGSVDLLLVDLTKAAMIGVSTTVAIDQFIDQMQAEQTPVRLIVKDEQKRQELSQSHLLKSVGKDNFVESLSIGVQSLYPQTNNETNKK